MAYLIHISDTDRAYLDSLPLSDRVKANVEDFLLNGIAQVDDAFRTDPANRTSPNPSHLEVRLLLWDLWGDRRFHQIRFVLNDQQAAFGILFLVFVDHEQR